VRDYDAAIGARSLFRRAYTELEWLRTDRLSSGAAVVLAAGAILAALIATSSLDPGRPLWFFASLALVVLTIAAASTLAYRRSGSSLKAVAISPLAIAAATWGMLFVLRPLDLYVGPERAVLGLAQFGFSRSDLTRTVAIGALGCACWSIGYLLTLGTAPTTRPPLRPATVSGRGAALALAVGTLLWGLLFLRQGGPAALLEAAGSLRANQTGSFYGFVGVWLVQGVVLVSLAAVLRGGGRTARRAVLAGIPLSVAAAVALELRGLATFAAVSAVIIFVTLRRVRRRYVVAGAVLAVLGVLVLGVTQQVRAYSTRVSTAEAIRLTAKTPLGQMYESDLSTFDNFVAVQSLVPGSVPYLEGQTLFEIPVALVPRRYWADKPLGIDFRTSGLLYPGVSVAVPIGLQGELYWNGGLPLVALGALALGLAFGLLGRLGLRMAPGSGMFVLYAAATPLTHAFLTRGLATMTANLVFAVVGVGGALLLVGGERPASVIARVVQTSRNRFVAPSQRVPPSAAHARRVAAVFAEFSDRFLCWRSETGAGADPADAAIEHDYGFYRRQFLSALEQSRPDLETFESSHRLVGSGDRVLSTLAAEPTFGAALERWRHVPDDRLAAEFAESGRRLEDFARWMARRPPIAGD
jgi:hypothetical protein